ncbi:MAG: zinc-binding alcohol dehydrogenase [Phycisphaeraceae bacterium]
MKADRIVFAAHSQPVFETVDLPEPAAGQVVVRTLHSLISPGTELARLYPEAGAAVNYPFYPGYTASATVIAMAGDVKDFTVGQTVAAWMPHASAAVLDAANCWSLPANLPVTEAAAFRLVSIALQGVRKAEIQLGHTVAILGLGVIGNLAGQVARAAGATRVLGIDPITWRRDLATRCGFDAVEPSADIAERFDVVIEASGVPAAVNQAFALARRLGRVVLLGSTRGVVEQVDFYRDVHRKGLTVIGAHESTRSGADDIAPLCTHRTDGRVSLQLLGAKRVTVAPLLSHSLPAREAPQAYRRLHERSEQWMTVVLDWQNRQ